MKSFEERVKNFNQRATFKSEYCGGMNGCKNKTFDSDSEKCKECLKDSDYACDDAFSEFSNDSISSAFVRNV